MNLQPASDGFAPKIYNVKAYGAKGDNSTNDTVAIQAAITAASNAGGGKVFFPAGCYVVSGALQTTGGANAQLVVPTLAATTTMLHIELAGEYGPDNTVAGGTSDFRGSVIRSTLTTGSGTRPCIIGGTNSALNWVYLGLTDLCLRLTDNPGIACVDGYQLAALNMHRVVCDTGTAWASISQPTHTNGVAVYMPTISNSNWGKFGPFKAFGFYKGIVAGEHLDGDIIALGKCLNGLVVEETQYHDITINRFITQQCKTGLKITSGAFCYLTIHDYDTETDDSNAGNWFYPSYDIDDTASYAVGNVRWHAVKAGTGPQHVFRTVGGGALAIKEVGKFPVRIQSALSSPFTLTGEATFADTGLSIVLPGASYGITYNLGSRIRALMQTTSANSYIAAKLYDSTAAADVADSLTLVLLCGQSNVAYEQTAIIDVQYTVYVDSTIKLYAERAGGGTYSDGRLLSDTTLGKTYLYADPVHK